MERFEVQRIRGWRGKIEDVFNEVRHRFWNASFLTVYDPDKSAPDPGNLVGHVRWFRRVFEHERSAASEELRKLRMLRQRIRRAERSPEQREHDRAWWKQWRASKSPEWKAHQTELKRKWRAANPERSQATERSYRERTGERRNAGRRALRQANRERENAYSRAYKARHRDRINAARRALYAAKRAAISVAPLGKEHP